MPTARLALLFALSLSFILWPRTAAAETFDTCVGFIDSVPATITAQGTWCMDGNLGTSISSGNAITVATNNVTIDCNGFKLGGLAAGAGSLAVGIFANARQNITVRNCSIRGFNNGIYLHGGGGHVVENNRLDGNIQRGIQLLYTDRSRVSGNVVYDTGAGGGSVIGIYAFADVIDNVVDGVTCDLSPCNVVGIAASGSFTLVRGNRVRGLVRGSGIGVARGIGISGSGKRVEGNFVSAAVLTPGYGIEYEGAPPTTMPECRDNTVFNFDSGIEATCTGGGNLASP